MPSATTADSSDSMAPSMAMAKAGPISSMTRDRVISGRLNSGRPCGMPPNALPMVATPSKWNADWITVANAIATSGPGTRFRPGNLGATRTRTRLAVARSVVATCRLGSAWSRCQSFS
ncbi:hypothetical protein D3C76_1471800 [compost metagenome]